MMGILNNKKFDYKLISNELAVSIIKECELVVGSSYTHPYIDEGGEYEIMTGYWIKNGQDYLIARITKKDDSGNFYTENILQIPKIIED